VKVGFHGNSLPYAGSPPFLVRLCQFWCSGVMT